MCQLFFIKFLFFTKWFFTNVKCGKEEKKIQKFEYLDNEKTFLVKIKNIFHSFQRAIIWWKDKNLIKNSGHKFYMAEDLLF